MRNQKIDMQVMRDAALALALNSKLYDSEYKGKDDQAVSDSFEEANEVLDTLLDREAGVRTSEELYMISVIGYIMGRDMATFHGIMEDDLTFEDIAKILKEALTDNQEVT